MTRPSGLGGIVGRLPENARVQGLLLTNEGIHQHRRGLMMVKEQH